MYLLGSKVTFVAIGQKKCACAAQTAILVLPERIGKKVFYVMVGVIFDLLEFISVQGQTHRTAPAPPSPFTLHSVHILQNQVLHQTCELKGAVLSTMKPLNAMNEL